MHEPSEGPHAGGVFIECAKCGASSVLMHPEKCDARPLVAERWNRRADEPGSRVRRGYHTHLVAIDKFDLIPSAGFAICGNCKERIPADRSACPFCRAEFAPPTSVPATTEGTR